MTDKKQQALDYHETPLPGKITVIPTTPCTNADELSLAYSPGVAEPCNEIAKDKSKVYSYTTKGNLVGIISNGTAVLGLGNIGPEASKPVMEGKGVLFKRFADVDFFDLEINQTDITKFVEIVSSLEPTFGGINLEDIKAPECFEIETQLQQKMNIPIFHDDQHGTAIVMLAALQNALEIAEKEIQDVKMVISGAGAAALAGAKLLLDLGAKKENLFLIDSKGLVTEDRKDLNQYKQQFAQSSDYSGHKLGDAIKNSDLFIGVSVGNLVSKEMVQSMNQNPIIIAMANPDPEISYEDAIATRDDIIMGTGRSDYPNQVNNVLCFPALFRGALDTQAKAITTEMKLAAMHALADLAKQEVPQSVKDIYGKDLQFGREYIIPKIFDTRVLANVASAVAKAAIDSGVARKKIEDFEKYKQQLNQTAERLAQGKFV